VKPIDRDAEVIPVPAEPAAALRARGGS
jgi:hypothetical protein